LDAPGAEARLHLLPQDRRECVAVKPVENAPALLRANEVLVDVSRIVERLPHRIFRNLVKDDAPDGDPRLQHLREMPADRLAFTIRVSGQQQLGCVLHGRLEMRDLFALVARDDVIRREVLLHVDSKPAPVLSLDLLRYVGCRLREVTNMAVARLYPVFVSQESAESLCLRR